MRRGGTLRVGTVVARDGPRLDDTLAAWLPDAVGRPLSRSAIRRLIMAGAVRVDGRPPRRAGLTLNAGARIEAVIQLDRLEAAGSRDVPFALTEKHVLYEDDLLIAVDKPPGLPTHPTADPARPHLFGVVKSFLASRDGRGLSRSEAPYLGLHQRLDRDTSGVVLFTKHPAANPGLAALFAGREIEKTYHALTARPPQLPPRTWRAVSQLGPAGRGQKARVGTVRSGGVLAETEFTRLESLPRGLLIEARPRTGRKHQIRVQLAEAGMPILGDTVYGSSSGAPRLMLHAASLSFAHPLTGAAVVIDSPRPEDFRRVLMGLRDDLTRRDARPGRRPR